MTTTDTPTTPGAAISDEAVEAALNANRRFYFTSGYGSSNSVEYDAMLAALTAALPYLVPAAPGPVPVTPDMGDLTDTDYRLVIRLIAAARSFEANKNYPSADALNAAQGALILRLAAPPSPAPSDLDEFAVFVDDNLDAIVSWPDGTGAGRYATMAEAVAQFRASRAEGDR